jgi:hypothetical protein
VAAAALTFELAYGVALGDALLYSVYELGFVVVPGWLAYRALSHRPGGALRQLAMGWALGYVLEILAFMLTAATGTRGLFVAYPLLMGAAALAAIARRGPLARLRIATPRPQDHFSWLLASVCLAAIAYIALAYFPGSPMPGTRSFGYFPDYPRWISLAADAKHHWPIEDPSVSGEPLPYHYFVYIHMAAASQVTGLGIPLVFFRLFIFPLVVLLVIEFAVAGRNFAGSAYVGLIAAGLALFVGELRLDTTQTFSAQLPFLGLFFTFVFRSPSFLLGLVMFLPLITLLGERFDAGEQEARPSDWLLIVLFMIGASDAKVSILPLLLAGLLLYAGWSWLANRRIPCALGIATALTLLVAGTVYFLQYRGHSSGLGVDLFAPFDGMPAVVSIKGELARALPALPAKGTVLSAGGIVFGLFGLLVAQLIGLVWIFRRQGPHLRIGQAWLISLFAAGLLMTLTFNQPTAPSTMYFLCFGLAAGCLLSAEGLQGAWRSRPAWSGQTKRFAIVGVALVLLLVALIVAPLDSRIFTGPHRQAHAYMFWYGGLLLALVVLYAAARRWIGPTRWGAIALVSGAVLVVGTLDTPIDYLQPAFSGQASKSLDLGRPLTPEVYRALSWIRDETPPDAVIAVNNQWIDTARTVPLEFNYSAFAERRAFLEGWLYSQRTVERGDAPVAAGANPFAGRLRLNEAAFEQGNRHALATMTDRYGVRYLVVDKLNGYPADLAALHRVSRTVYRAPGVVVVELQE